MGVIRNTLIKSVRKGRGQRAPGRQVEEGRKNPTATSRASMMLAAWEVEPEASAVQKLSVRFPKGRLSMNGVMFTLGVGGRGMLDVRTLGKTYVPP
jgi:hypothetical protein